MKKSLYTSALLFFFISSISSAQSFTSDSERVNIIELYTSEGCSSCPPADKWLRKLKRDPRLWSEFIPMAFHVDYWDYIGWKDPFANPQFSNRQRQYSIEHNLSSVYTPGMLLNGREWTSWRRQSNLKLSPNVITGTLSVDLNDGVINANYQPINKKQSDLILNIAVLGFDLNVDITAGENKGKTLTHDFVVLGLHRVAMKLSTDGQYTVSSAKLPKLNIHPSTIALSAWVNNDSDLSPIQATGGWIN
ncbi:MAG: DUF1223 domain-containing protein [Piscirickettsiaceae bacterium]|nr:DUF1223 domain-containing protein [Piscirickettsiaceae bacterium]